MRVLVVVIIVGALCAACGDVQASVRVKPSSPTTECQDHTLPCAGPPVTGATVPPTIPVMDPAHKDLTVLDAQTSSSTTPITLPSTS